MICLFGILLIWALLSEANRRTGEGFGQLFGIREARLRVNDDDEQDDEEGDTFDRGKKAEIQIKHKGEKKEELEKK